MNSKQKHFRYETPMKTFKVYRVYNNIDSYKETDHTWQPCTNCGLQPKIWTFNNGRSTACGCWNTAYDHFSIFSESILSVYKRTQATIEYDSDELRTNWNHWVDTGEILFKHAKYRDDGRF